MTKDDTVPSTAINSPKRSSLNSLSSSDTQKAVNYDAHRPSIALEKQISPDRGVISITQKLEASPEQPSPAAEPDVELLGRQAPAFDDEAEKNYKPKTFKFWSVIFSIFVSMFLVGLDRTIISTAIPQITNDFHSLGDIGWYGSAYMLTTAAFQLLFGRIYRFYDLRWTLLTCIILFEVGSAICGAAPNSTAFIFGRAIAGAGSAGIFTGSMMTIIPMVPLHKRPMFQGMFGMVFGISAVTGPLIGGALTGKSTWRWCFYMNLPVGAVALVCLVFFLESPKKEDEGPLPVTEHITRLDPLGTFFFIPSVVCLILALQWGGSTYAWSNWRIIVLFVLSGITGVAFCAVQVMMPETATVPLRIIKQRTMLSGAMFMFLLSGSMMIVVYYVPLWFQATKGVDPVKSGIYTIPLVLSLVVASIVSAAITQRIGYYVPAMIFCACLMAVGGGLLSTFKVDTGSPKWIAYQFLMGFGTGFGMQTVGLAVQATLPRQDISTGLAITFFVQQLSGAIFVSVGQTLLSGLLVDRLSGIPGLEAKDIVNTGATDLHDVIPAQYLDRVLGAYNYACTRIFLVAMALSLAQVLCALCVEWKSIKKGKQGPPGETPGQGAKSKDGTEKVEEN